MKPVSNIHSCAMEISIWYAGPTLEAAGSSTKHFYGGSLLCDATLLILISRSGKAPGSSVNVNCFQRTHTQFQAIRPSGRWERRLSNSTTVLCSPQDALAWKILCWSIRYRGTSCGYSTCCPSSSSCGAQFCQIALRLALLVWVLGCVSLDFGEVLILQINHSISLVHSLLCPCSVGSTLVQDLHVPT